MSFLKKVEAAWSTVEYKVRVRQENVDEAADKKLIDDFEKALAALLNKFNKGKEVNPISCYPVLPGLNK